MQLSRILLAGFFIVASVGISSQELTRIAIVDLQRIIKELSDPAMLRSFDTTKVKIQAQIDAMGEEINMLYEKKAELDQAEDKSASLAIKNEINDKTRNLENFVNTKQKELADQAKLLRSKDNLAQQLYVKIQKVAEDKGYTLVLNLKSGDSVSNAIIWYSPMIDITEDVLQSLQIK